MSFLLFALGLPFGVALVVLGAAALLGRRTDTPTSPRWAGAVGLGGGYALGHAAAFEWGNRAVPWFESIRGWWKGEEDWPFYVLDAGMWIFWIVMAAAILATLDTIWSAPAWARWQTRLIAVGLILGLVLRGKYINDWDGRQGVTWSLGIGAAILVGLEILDAKATRLGAGMPLPLAMTACGLAAVMILHHSILRMLLAGALGSAMAGVWVVSWWDRSLNLGRGGIPVFATAFSALLLDAYFWEGNVPRSIVILLALAPLATFIDRISPISRLRPRQMGLVRAFAVAIPVAIAIGLAYAWRPPEIPMG